MRGSTAGSSGGGRGRRGSKGGDEGISESRWRGNNVSTNGGYRRPVDRGRGIERR